MVGQKRFSGMPTAKLSAGAKRLTSSQRQYRSDFPAGFIKPQLCELVKSPPVGDNWVHETKLDGYRMQMQVRNGKSTFYSRKGLDWTHRFPEIARACQAMGNAIIDGEVCAVGSDGLPTFAGLTDALSAKRTGSLVYYAFDLMAEDTESLVPYPLFTRKNALKQLTKKLKLGDRERVVYVDHQGDGKARCTKLPARWDWKGSSRSGAMRPISRMTGQGYGVRRSAGRVRNWLSEAGRLQAARSAP